MPFQLQIVANAVELVLIFLICGVVIVRGLPEVALGMYLSLSLWTRVVLIGPIAQAWFMLGVIILAVLVDLHRRKKVTVLPRNYRGILVWLVCWLLWITALLNFREPLVMRGFLRMLLLYVALPIPVVLLFASDVKRIRSFAIAFILTTFVGGWKALSMIDITLDYLLTDPTLSDTNIIRLGLINYHWFAYMFDLSLAFILAMYAQVRRNVFVMALLLAGAAICAYFLLLAGSRQAINGAVVILAVFVAWSLTHRNTPKLRSVVLATLVLGIGVQLYLTSPSLVLREGESGWFDTVNVVSDRGFLWEIGWRNFENSPIFGSKFEFYVDSHNIVIGTLADQGIVGMFFLIGLVIFILWQCKGIWNGSGSNEVSSWRIAFFSIAVFTFVHGMASGSVLSSWYLFVSAAMLWWLRQLWEEDQALPEAAPMAKPVRSTLRRRVQSA